MREILKNAFAWAKELKEAEWELIEKTESGRKIDPVDGLAWKDPKEGKLYDMKNAYLRMKHPIDTKPAKKPDPKKPEKIEGNKNK